MDGFWSRIKGRAKASFGVAAGKPGLAREGMREERIGEIDARRAELAREEARLAGEGEEPTDPQSQRSAGR